MRPTEQRDVVKRLRKNGLLISEIVERTGVPKGTVIRWCNPKLEIRERRNARKRKFSQQRYCPDCGRKMSNSSGICLACYRQGQRYWTQERLSRAAREWAAKHGRVPTSDDWRRSSKYHPAVKSVVGKGMVFRSWGDLLNSAGFGLWHNKKNRGLSPRERKMIRRELREEAIRKAVGKGDVQTEETM